MTKVKNFLKKIPLPLKIILLAVVLYFSAVTVFRIVLKIVPYSGLEEFKNHQYSTRFYDKNGTLLQIMPLEEGLYREYLPLEKFPPSLIQEFINQEDKNFYSHNGVDFFSIARAFFQNRKSKKIVSGASTITMQLVRIISPRKESVSLKLKISEAIKACHLEAKLSKKEILELYINNLPFGNQIEGAASAARTFYSAEPSQLTEEQIKTLALIPRRPKDYAPEKTFTYPFEAPHFINYVIKEYKLKNQVIPPQLTLSVDLNLIKLIQNELLCEIEKNSSSRIHNGAAFVINNQTGEIIAWLGNADFFDDDNSGQIDGVLVKNQPGSSMKPLLYAFALENGFPPSSILPDIPQSYGGEGVYIPLNFNNGYNGPVRFRVALGSSLNVPAVYLLNRLGVTNYMDFLQKAGYTSLEGTRQSTGLSLALGSSEVTLYEMVKAFSIFANDGNILENTQFLSCSSSFKPSMQKVISKDTARIMCDILSDDASRKLGFGFAKVFQTDYPCMFKTGTSNQFQNIIALGSTSNFTAGVWMGNFEGQTVVGKTGSSIPALIVRKTLDYLTAEYGAQKFKSPESYEKIDVCVLSGMKAGKNCPSVTKEFYSKLSDKRFQECSWHRMEKGTVKVYYPTEYQHWLNGKNNAGEISQEAGPLEITYPRNNSLFFYDLSLPPSVQFLRIEAVGGSSPTASLYADGKFVCEKSQPFYWNIPLEKGNHFVTVECNGEAKTVSYTVK